MNAIALPSREIQHYHYALRVVYHDPRKGGGTVKSYGGNSTKVKDYNPRTARRLGLHLSEFGHLYNKEITLTWPSEFPTDGMVVREKRLRMLRKLKKYGVEEYTWTLEFQERGAPHIHILIDRYVDLRWLSEEWYEIVGSGDPRHLKAGTEINEIRDITKTKLYMCSYARKKDQKDVPKEYINCGRFWDSNRSVKPQEVEICEYTDVREMNRESRNITRWRKAVKRKTQKSTGKKYKAWKVENGKGFLAWGDNGKLRETIDKLKAQAPEDVPF